MRERIALAVTLILLTFFFISCRSSGEKEANGNALFQLQSAAATGINFENTVEDTKEMNIFSFHNFYNGGGVAIGDINNDGKPDIFFTSNKESNKLYLNKGNWKFEDITAKAGLTSTNRWHTGVVMADVNGDGWLDIYVSNSGDSSRYDRTNELYINQQNGTFKESAAQYGLADKGPSVQAAFFDYDHDGDLDCFVLNNSPRSAESFGYSKSWRYIRDAINGDHLYRNDNGKFTDVSEQAGIYGSEIGFGLGITIGDVNNDGWEDMYVSNDFFERDYLYINQHNGTFKEVINDAMGHISQGSMGSDMADINNDGYLDIFTSEMLPESDYRLKTTIRFDDYDVIKTMHNNDYHYQLTSNCLQLNNHNGTFSEIAQLGGVDATGWSWGALCFDFDNDGWKDIYVCNGINRDLTDQDFLAYFSNEEVLSQIKEGGFNYKDLLSKMPSVPVPNYAFLNQKNLRFENATSRLGFDEPSFSNGAAYGDIDGDGDMDLVINNENSPAFVYRNMTTEKWRRHFLSVKLAGNTANTFGYGARVTLYTKDKQQVLEQMPERGFQSSSEPVLHFGLGEDSRIDSLVIKWPGGKVQALNNVQADTLLTLFQKDAVERTDPPEIIPTWYTNIASSSITGSIQHVENEFVDFDAERLIPRMISTEGPKLAVGDINGDGLEDFYLCSTSGDTAKLYVQQSNGKFMLKQPLCFVMDKYYESTGAAFFDEDGDGDQDLVVASGGNQAREGSPYLEVRLYVNEGKGNFTRKTDGWPIVSVNASCIRVGDFNGDGKPDVFVGARNVPGSYGMMPSSALLENKGKGLFANVTATAAPGLQKAGMVTDAQWVDLDGDGQQELVMVGDWMPVTIIKFKDGKEINKTTIPVSSGWWNCLVAHDMDGDGDMDLVAGNFGLNSRIRADEQHPARLYISDFAQNGRIACIPVYYKTDGKAYPYYLKGELEAQIPQIKKQFLQFSAYAGKSIEELFPEDQLKQANVLKVDEAQTCVFMNDGKGHFTKQALPLMAQLSPIFGILPVDVNKDGITDLFMGGNFYGCKPQMGRFDADYGTTLLGNTDKLFTYVPPYQTGLWVKGEVRDIALLHTADKDSRIIVGMNNSPLYLFRKNEVEQKKIAQK